MKCTFLIRGNGLTVGRVPSCPTKALPGTAEKVEVMRARVERGELAFHPDDATHRIEGAGIPAEVCLPVTEGGKLNDTGGRYDRMRSAMYARWRVRKKRFGPS